MLLEICKAAPEAVQLWRWRRPTCPDPWQMIVALTPA